MTLTPLELAQAEQATLPMKIAGATIWLLSAWTGACLMLGHWPWS